MLGAIIGDIVGSHYEWNNHKSKDFTLFTKHNFFTDDTVLTVAIAKAIMNGAKDDDFVEALHELGNKYPKAGYGASFVRWLKYNDRLPYNSWGNGSAMRVSPVGWCCNTLEQTLELATKSACVTHNHPEGIKGAKAVAGAIYLLRTGSSKEEVKDWITNVIGYDLDFTLDGIRDDYYFDVSCQGSVPQAIVAFLEATDFEGCIRNAISIGGDSDTIGAIAGSIAEAYYPIPKVISDKALSYLDDYLFEIYNQWQGYLK